MSGAVERSDSSGQAKDLAEGAGETVPLSEKEKFRTRPHRLLTRGHVYFIRGGDTIKIGFSTDPNERLASLQVQSPAPLELLATTPGTVRHERTLHQRFEHLKVTGEWFRAEPELMAFIDHVRKTGSTKFPVNEEARLAKLKLRRLAAMHRDKIAVTARAQTIICQLNCLAKVRDDEPRVQRLRLAIADTTASLNQVMRDGGEYIPANHMPK